MNINTKRLYLSKQDIENQEHLATQILSTFVADNIENLSQRPMTNFIELMTWVQNNFSFKLQDKDNLNRFVHNRVIVDGQFILFCKENNISIECLYKDSIVSWKTENEFEKFFIQGVFYIKSNDVEFLHAALFHKGNSFEDEVSFFIILSEKNYENYLKLRNKFDNWVQERDRSNLHVRVVSGDDIPYVKDYSWDDLFLPDDIKLELRNSVECFLSSKDFYLKNRIPWKRGILLYGNVGCGKTTIIKTIMSVYNFKPVTINSEANNDILREAFSYAEEQSPSLLYIEDLDSLFDKGIDLSTFLNLMDGVCTKNGLLVVATANDIHKLKASITNRPSRFDRKFEIPLPTQEMAYIYLKRWFGNLIDSRKCRELAKQSEKYEFSYAYLKELYLSSMFEALSNNRKSPTNKDIEQAMKSLIKDKTLLGNDSINTDKYFNK